MSLVVAPGVSLAARTSRLMRRRSGAAPCGVDESEPLFLIIDVFVPDRIVVEVELEARVIRPAVVVMLFHVETSFND